MTGGITEQLIEDGIPEDWEYKRLDDIVERKNSRVDAEDMDDEIYLSMKHMDEKEPVIHRYGNSEEVSSKKYKFEKSDILFGRLRPYLHKVGVPLFDGICSTEVWVLNANEEVDRDYLLYVLFSDTFVEIADSSTTGTGRPRANWSTVKETEIPLPPIEKQKQIGKLLHQVDMKRQLNRELAGLLEETAHAIYESWFEAYEPYDIPDDQDVPESFSEHRLGQLATVEPGNSPDSDYYNENQNGTPFYQGNADMGRFYPEVSTWTQEETKKSSKGEVLMTVRAPVGNINRNHKDAVIGRGIAGIDMKDNSNAYLYHLLESEKEKIKRMGTGTTYESVSSDDLRNYSIIAPKRNEIQRFNRIVEYFHRDILRMKEENKKLEVLRDYLLPQLLSGEIVIQDEEDEQEDTKQGDTE